MNRNTFKLTLQEQKTEPVLWGLLAISAIAVIKGISNEKSGIDQDFILWPLFSTAFGMFCLIYGINALTTGNLVRKWMTPFVFNPLFSLIKKRNRISNDEALIKTTRFLGIVVLFIAVSLFISEVIFFIHPYSI